MITLKQNPPAPIANITVSGRAVVAGALGRPVVAGTIRVYDLHGQVVLTWQDDDVDQTLHDMVTKTSFDTAGIDFQVMPQEGGDWLTVEATEGTRTRCVKTLDFDYFDLVAKAMKDNAAWSEQQPEARELRDHRNGI